MMGQLYAADGSASGASFDIADDVTAKDTYTTSESDQGVVVGYDSAMGPMVALVTPLGQDIDAGAGDDKIFTWA
ncbi:MAG: hypothetical protein EBT13_07435, partial [Rhodobacteraceae bacterium]|nr:hypothetical protein [Paracoccaceae bacterium]